MGVSHFSVDVVRSAGVRSFARETRHFNSSRCEQVACRVCWNIPYSRFSFNHVRTLPLLRSLQMAPRCVCSFFYRLHSCCSSSKGVQGRAHSIAINRNVSPWMSIECPLCSNTLSCCRGVWRANIGWKEQGRVGWSLFVCKRQCTKGDFGRDCRLRGARHTGRAAPRAMELWTGPRPRGFCNQEHEGSVPQRARVYGPYDIAQA